MNSYEYGFLAAIVSIIGILIIPLFYGFKMWKIAIIGIIVSTLISVIILFVSFYLHNKGVSGNWGESGIIHEFLNPRIWGGGLFLGVSVTLILVSAIFLSKK